ncbi:MAG: glycosyltransferase family 2 protein [Candidatus Omnitrophica bacterium]|nr:glycosyltransferase family 2 protein [Candidatus Omnitrophota bacterium]
MFVLFWISLSIILYTYFFYPVILLFISDFIKRGVEKDEALEPTVTLLIPAYNEEAYIGEKIENSLNLDYPPERLRIVIANDGSVDRTVEIAKQFEGRVEVIGFEENRGKARLINHVMERVESEIVVFSDASCFLDRHALRIMMRNFKDERVGCVCGLYRLKDAREAVHPQNEGLYWKYETFIKRKESDICSILGAHGAIYGIRRALFVPLGEGVINDDYFIPMQIVAAGHRAIYDERVVAYEQHLASEEGEFSRRVRITVGNFQQIVAFFRLLHPKRGLLAFEFFSHKLLRPLIPFFLIMLLIANCFIEGTFYRIFVYLQVVFYLLAGAGYILQKQGLSNPVFSLPFYFTMTNLAGLVGMVKFLQGHRAPSLWKKPI